MNIMYTLLARLIVLLTSLPVHEAAHAYAARKMGDNTSYYKGRISLNPLEHIDPMGALMILFVGIGWGKPVEVNSYYFRDRKWGTIVTAAAGPLSNIGLAAISLIVYKIFIRLVLIIPFSSFIFSGLANVLSIMVYANISLAVFNLIPIPPLDGWKIFSEFMPANLRYQIQSNQRAISLFLIFFVLFLGILDGPISFISGIIFSILDAATFFVDILMGLLI